jgi:TRAP-type mannitol/chloroaromatic compound transport system substrate-binding protein
VAKNYMLSSYHQASESFEYIFNKDKFESLAPDLQAILKYGVEAAHLANFSLAMNQYSTDLAKLANEHGVNVKRTPDSVLEAQLGAWDKILPPLMEDPFFAKVVESQKAWCERVVYYSLNNAPDYKLAFQHYFPGKI